MSNMMKYSTDEYGNVYPNQCQIEPVEGMPCYNPRTETLDEPFVPDQGKRLIVENGQWNQIAISIEHVEDIIEGQKRIRPKTQIERYASGVDIIPKGFKLSEDKKDLIEKHLKKNYHLTKFLRVNMTR